MRPLAFVSFLLLAASPISAQQWSAEETEVIDSIKQCWDTWMEAVRAHDADIWISECTDGDFSYWGSEEGVPEGPDALRRDWERIRASDADWIDLRPLRVKMIGDVAIVQFYGYWLALTAEGSTRTEWMRTEIFHKVNGRWLLVAGHSNPASSADARPYFGDDR